jgi:hypothetical protein
VGKPAIKGTRLAVEFIIDLLAQGWTENDIAEENQCKNGDARILASEHFVERNFGSSRSGTK